MSEVPKSPSKFDEVAALIAEAATEGQYLEFKSGQALSRSGGHPAAIVKAATGMANAAGGRIVYGLSEEKRADGVRAASGWAPVVDQTIDAEWVTQIIKGNSAPPLQRFDVREIALPETIGAGRILIVDVEAAATAHQSTLDQKYYQRSAKSTTAMLDHQIRDVMGRRTSPVIDIRLIRSTPEPGDPLHVFTFTPELTNMGLISLEKWLLEIDIPSDAIDHGALSGYMTISRTSERIDGCDFTRLRIPSAGPGIAPSTAQGLYPGQSIRLDGAMGVPVLRLHITNALVHLLEQIKPSIRWRLFMPNARPALGEMPFEQWRTY